MLVPAPENPCPVPSLPGPGDFVNDPIVSSGASPPADLCLLRFQNQRPTIKAASRIPPKATPMPIPAFAPEDNPPELLSLEAEDVVVVALDAVVVVAVDVNDVDAADDVVVVVALFQTTKSGDQPKNPERAFPS